MARAQELLEGLQALAAGAFPRSCPNCGRNYATFEQFLAETRPAGRASGLKEGMDDEAHPLVEVYRNCACGSTLMDFADDRRDRSVGGENRRERFEQMVVRLEGHGLSGAVAREELRALLRGEASPRIAHLLRGERGA